MKASQGCSEQATTVRGEATPDDHNDKEKLLKEGSTDSSRRSFLGKVGGATAAALAVGIPLEPLFEGKRGAAEASVIPYGSSRRTYASWHYRDSTADAEKINVGELPDNGDAQRFTDFSGSWSKCLKHDYLGIVNRASWLSLVNALQTGRFSGFPKHHGRQSRRTGFHRHSQWSDGRLCLRLRRIGLLTRP